MALLDTPVSAGADGASSSSSPFFVRLPPPDWKKADLPDRGHRSLITIYYTVGSAGDLGDVDPYYRNFTDGVSERLPEFDRMISDWLASVRHDACEAADGIGCRRFTVLHMRYVRRMIPMVSAVRSNTIS